MIAVLIQARMDSTRLPEKVMKPIAGKPMLWHVLTRAKKIEGIDAVMVATVDSPKEKPIVQLCEKLGVSVFKGDREDVLNRYYMAASEIKADAVMRITSDCPLIDPALAGDLIKRFSAEKPDYMANNIVPSFPHGLDMEVMTFNSLEIANSEARAPFEREHVTPYIRNNRERFTIKEVAYAKNLYHLRVTVDEQADLQVVESIMQKRGIGANFEDIISLSKETPALFELNRIAANRHIKHISKNKTC